ncbi:hypothetical protein L209DRAFT_348579 [Thermothelomyces heterothallicus CBS 203.75]
MNTPSSLTLFFTRPLTFVHQVCRSTRTFRRPSCNSATQCINKPPTWFQCAVTLTEPSSSEILLGSNSMPVARGMGMTPLMAASYFGIVPVVKALVKAGGSSSLHARDDIGCAALIWARWSSATHYAPRKRGSERGQSRYSPDGGSFAKS